MSGPASALVSGHVVHKRLRPSPHALRYGVFSLLIDVDDIAKIAAGLRLFSHNRFNVFSLHDRDYGAGDGQSLAHVARAALDAAGRPSAGRTIRLLTYPRILGYAFNPLSVYYVDAPDGSLETVIYEVSNTFAERTSYVVPAGAPAAGGVYAQACRKAMYVSPFADAAGRYSFRIVEPRLGADMVVGVLFSDGAGPLIKTHFCGRVGALRDGALAAAALRYPLMTLKIIVAIHYEALKLWVKGIPLTSRPVSPRYRVLPTAADQQGPL
ncbi:MAG: DUF1365 domain-containing protein [Hyphomicrobium sp.]